MDISIFFNLRTGVRASRGILKGRCRRAGGFMIAA
jgi:hypothetical protein